MEISLLLFEVIILVAISAMCSGLNIALMSLGIADLTRKSKLGNSEAKRVLPLRKNSHLTLAAILLTNVGVISATSLVLDKKFNGLVAGITSTLLIVIFGEVIPQALFARNALHFCARLAPMLKIMIIITYPIAKPLQLLLDKFLAQRSTPLHNRLELGLIISEHMNHKESELDRDEVSIIRGALQLSEKRVRDIMTPIHKVFCLQPTDIIDAQTIDDIKAANWSRIPIINKAKTECHGILLMKDLVDIDFDEQPYPISALPLRACLPVGSMTALDTMFRRFIAGRTHLIPVEKDDKIIGIVTIEDLLEEILGQEIEDETDEI